MTTITTVGICQDVLKWLDLGEIRLTKGIYFRRTSEVCYVCGLGALWYSLFKIEDGKLSGTDELNSGNTVCSLNISGDLTGIISKGLQLQVEWAFEGWYQYEEFASRHIHLGDRIKVIMNHIIERGGVIDEKALAAS